MHYDPFPPRTVLLAGAELALDPSNHHDSSKQARQFVSVISGPPRRYMYVSMRREATGECALGAEVRCLCQTWLAPIGSPL